MARCVEIGPAGLLGNQIFELASGYGIAQRLNASLCMRQRVSPITFNYLPDVLAGPLPICTCNRSAYPRR